MVCMVPTAHTQNNFTMSVILFPLFHVCCNAVNLSIEHLIILTSWCDWTGIFRLMPSTVCSNSLIAMPTPYTKQTAGKAWNDRKHEIIIM